MIGFALALSLSGAPDFEVKTANGRWSFRPSLVARPRSDAVFQDGAIARQETGFQMFRPRLFANVGAPWLRVMLQPETAGNGGPALLDAELRATPRDEIKMKVGQFVTPYSRAFITPVPHLQFAEFSLAEGVFRRGRALGMMLYGLLADGHVEYWAAGVTDAVGVPALDRKNDVTYMGRFAVNPGAVVPYDNTPGRDGDIPRRFAIGINAFAREDRWSAGGDAVLQWWRVTTLAQGFAATGDGGRVASGGYWQAAIFAIPQKLEPALRGTVMTTTGRRDDLLYQLDAFLNWYIYGDNLKLWVGYSFADTPAPRGPLVEGQQHRILTQFQLSI